MCVPQFARKKFEQAQSLRVRNFVVSLTTCSFQSTFSLAPLYRQDQLQRCQITCHSNGHCDVTRSSFNVYSLRVTGFIPFFFYLHPLSLSFIFLCLFMSRISTLPLYLRSNFFFSCFTQKYFAPSIFGFIRLCLLVLCVCVFVGFSAFFLFLFSPFFPLFFYLALHCPLSPPPKFLTYPFH